MASQFMSMKVAEDTAETFTKQEAQAETFTLQEAQDKLGKTVRLLSEHNHFPKGVIGYVVDVHELAADEFEVVVRWDMPNGSEPVHDGFSRSKYDQLLSEQ
jgi:hypothetical protein